MSQTLERTTSPLFGELVPFNEGTSASTSAVSRRPAARLRSRPPTRFLKRSSSLRRTASTFFLQLSAALPDPAPTTSRTGQPDLDELKRLGIKVHDFAFTNGIPPLVPDPAPPKQYQPVFRKQYQPDPETLKRTSTDAKNEPESKPQSKRSRLEREDTEPIIDEPSSQLEGPSQRATTPTPAGLRRLAGSPTRLGRRSPARATSRSPSPCVPTPATSPAQPSRAEPSHHTSASQSADHAAISQPIESQALSEPSQTFGVAATGAPLPSPHSSFACPSLRSEGSAWYGDNNIAGPSTQRGDSAAGDNLEAEDDSMDVDTETESTASPIISAPSRHFRSSPPVDILSGPAKQASPKRYNLRRRPAPPSPPVQVKVSAHARAASPSRPIRTQRNDRPRLRRKGG